MQFKFLADCPEAIPQIASWYFEQWGHQLESTSRVDIENKLRDSLNRDKIPLLILAILNEEIIGVAELKFREMDIYPEKEHWLGGVYVPLEHRGKGIASQLIRQALRIAQSLGVSTLFLQTEKADGGLYSSLGWSPVEQINNRGLDVLVMANTLDDKQAESNSTINED